MHVEVKGADLPGLRALMERMQQENKNVLVGVPAGAEEDGGHARSAKGTEKLTKRISALGRRMDARARRLVVKKLVNREVRRARTQAVREFKRATLGTDEEYTGGGVFAKATREVSSQAAAAARAYHSEQINANLNWIGKGSRQVAPTGPIPLAMIAAVHEFGQPEKGIPERSFLRAGIRRAAPRFQALNRRTLRAVVLGGMTVEQAVEMLGNVAVGEVKREFTVGHFAPLKESTKKRKGSSRPLVDTGQLRQSITFQLEGTQSANAKVIE